jgi:RNA polymerase-associated protein CTR9
VKFFQSQSLQTVRVLAIPIRGSNEFVEVRADELPADTSVVTGILKSEAAPLSLWLQFAVEYYRQGQVPAFIEVLTEGTDASLATLYPDAKKERIAMLNSLAAHHAGLAVQEKDTAEKDRLFSAATTLLNKADTIDVSHELTVAGKGSVLLAKGDLLRADHHFNIALDT